MSEKLQPIVPFTIDEYQAVTDMTHFRQHCQGVCLRGMAGQCQALNEELASVRKAGNDLFDYLNEKMNDKALGESQVLRKADQGKFGNYIYENCLEVQQC